MRTLLYSIGLMVLFTITACGSGMDHPKTDQDKIAEELDPTRNKETPVDPEWESRLGYVNYTKDQFKNERDRNQAINMDRNKMADTIARIILRNDGFEEIATLVTDEEVLIRSEERRVGKEGRK